MQGEMIRQYLSNPFVLAIVILVAMGLVVMLFLLLRKRRPAGDEENVRQQLVAMERESQFAAAVEQAPHQKEAVAVARSIAAIFYDYLNMPLLAIYAGREGDEHLTNLMPAVATGNLNQQSLIMERAVAAGLVEGYQKPLVVKLSAFPGARMVSAQSPDDPQAKEAAANLQWGGPSVDEQNAAILGWRGAFGWRGLLVARTDQADAEMLARLRDPLNRLTDKLAVALEIEREAGGVQESGDRLGHLTGLANTIVAGFDAPAGFDALAAAAAALLKADSAAIWMLDAEGQMLNLAGAYGLQAHEFLPLPRGKGLAGSILESGQALALEDAPADPRCLFPREARDSGIIGYLGAPILAEDRPLGVLEVHAAQPRYWSDEDAGLLVAAALLAGQRLAPPPASGAGLRAESAYMQLAEALQRLNTQDDVFEAAVELLGHALGVSRAIVVELDEQGRSMPVRHEFRDESVKSALGAAYTEGIYSRFASASPTGQPLRIKESRTGSLMKPESASSLQVMSEMALPVIVQGQTRAIIYLHQCDRERRWETDEAEFAERVARQVSLSLEHIRALDETARATEMVREELRRAMESGARSQAIINTLPEALLGLDREGRVTFFNATARDWLGVRAEDLGRAPTAIPALRMSDDALWGRIGVASSVSYFEGQIAEGPGGEPVRVSVAAAPVRNSQGAVTGRLVVISDIRHVGGASLEAAATLASLQESMADYESRLAEARRAVQDALAAEARARNEVSEMERSIAQMQQERDAAIDQQETFRKSSQQLLEINRLKSDFIVNAGRELEGSLQSVLGVAELLQRGEYGPLNEEQTEAVRGIYQSARRMKTDIDWLIEYGSTRSHRLESAGESA